MIAVHYSSYDKNRNGRDFFFITIRLLIPARRCQSTSLGHTVCKKKYVLERLCIDVIYSLYVINRKTMCRYVITRFPRGIIAFVCSLMLSVFPISTRWCRSDSFVKKIFFVIFRGSKSELELELPMVQVIQVSALEINAVHTLMLNLFFAILDHHHTQWRWHRSWCICSNDLTGLFQRSTTTDRSFIEFKVRFDVDYYRSIHDLNNFYISDITLKKSFTFFCWIVNCDNLPAMIRKIRNNEVVLVHVRFHRKTNI